MERVKDDRLLITNIQRFSLHDGPGIRTTVFLKGCSLHCPWCCNPENISPEIQKYVKDGKEGIFGRYIASDELLKEVLKDKDFYGEYVGEYKGLEELPGGVTFSGGEPLLQMQRLVPICEHLHEKNVHIAAETALFVPAELLEIAYEYIDLFYIDVKILDDQRAMTVVGGNLKQYLENLDWLMHREKVPSIVIRVPMISRYTDDKENREEIQKLLQKYREFIIQVEYLEEHRLGEEKRKALERNII